MGESQLIVLKLYNLSNYAKTFFFLNNLLQDAFLGWLLT